MKLITQLLCFAILSISFISCQQQKELFVTLEGKILNKDDVNTLAKPYLQIRHSKSSKGIIVYFPMSGSENDSIITVFNQMGFSVATLKGNNIKLADAIKAFRSNR